MRWSVAAGLWLARSARRPAARRLYRGNQSEGRAALEAEPDHTGPPLSVWSDSGPGPYPTVAVCVHC